MEGSGGTALRNAAPHWSLAGDKQLLDMLQNLHERIVSKCQETNTSLEAMVSSLDTASISLQNVNNRFMALSNSQFVESRVYDDDIDVATKHTPVKEAPKPADPALELAKLKTSLRTLESYHETVHILDSDTDSGSDDEEDRMVLKPKDLYADRPLPYIIGSHQWRSKWHVGLIPEDSDSDSDISKQGTPLEQYSDSEPEITDIQTDKPQMSQRTISTNSSIGSELTIPTVGKPADIAAELARRLGGNVPHTPPQESESPPAVTVPTKVYRPQQPVTATLFSDEPPPLDAYQSDHSDQMDQLDQSDHSESDGDVFAELHRNNARKRTNVANQLFGNDPNGHRNKGGFGVDGTEDGGKPKSTVKQSTPLFDDPQESELFVEKPHSKTQVHTESSLETAVKKPVGGISVFGNQGTESIGAAILKRNQRKSSTSDEDIEPKNTKNPIQDSLKTNKAKDKEVTNTKQDKTQKDLINDLFAKPNKKAEKGVEKAGKAVEKAEKAVENIEKPVSKKVDLFADDLFDDIDDIFTTVKAPVKEVKKVKQSLFDDDDDDDLFANIATPSSKSVSKPQPKSKTVFESDDDLFSDKIEETSAPKINNTLESGNTALDVNNDLLSENKRDSKILTKSQGNAATGKSESGSKNEQIPKESLSKTKNSIRDDKGTHPKEKSSISGKSRSIFDSDSDDDLFSDFKTINKNTISKTDQNKVEKNVNEREKRVSEGTDEFEENDNLFLPKDVSVIKNVSGTSAQAIDEQITKTIEKYEFLDDDSLFLHKEKVTDSDKRPILSQSIYNSQNAGDEFEDHLFNNDKTEKVITEIIEKSPEAKKKTIDNSKDEFFSNKNNETVNNENIPVFNSANKTKSIIKSPSLFVEDDEDDDIFKADNENDKSRISNIETNQSIEKPDVGYSESDRAQLRPESDENIFKNITETKDLLHEIIPSSIDNNASQKVDESQTTKTNEAGPNIDIVNDISAKISNVEFEEAENKLKTNTIKSYLPPISKDDLEKSAPIDEEPILEKWENNITDNTETEFVENELLFTEHKAPVSDEPDIFSDIFSDVPPEFEKPKEPKKSKNINALFDDDSDDEALFFKKNDMVSDEKPVVSLSAQEDRLFHIFHDEPPAIDVDFTQKAIKNKDLEPPIDITSNDLDYLTENNENIISNKLLNENFTDTFTNDTDTDSNSIEERKKPVGKLKPMNLNINVSTLLPGASPKKTISSEQVDGQTISKDTEEDAKDIESKLVKTVSFDDPESGILDNKLSKERAKIQVKRRPSTRRARKEAVRKSGIDFGDDSTDNSSSTDVSRKDEVVAEKSEVTPKVDRHVNKKDGTDSFERSELAVDKTKEYQDNITGTVEKTKTKVYNEETNIRNENNLSKNEVNASLSEDLKESSDITTATNTRTNVKSKVVYILNDEDIFTNTKRDQNESDNTQNIAKNKVLNIVDDDDDDDELFKSSTSNNKMAITKGKTDDKHKEIDKFDSDEDIFKASHGKIDKKITQTETVVSKTEIDQMEAKIDTLFVKSKKKNKNSLFDNFSDDENELFGGKKSSKENIFESKPSGSDAKKILPRVDVKKSLFGDESDDDDLFGVKTTKNKVSKQSASKPKEVSSKPAQPVFEDPLSMLGQEDDI